MKPARKRELADFLIQAYRVSIRRVTAVLQLRQATYFMAWSVFISCCDEKAG